MTEGKRNIIQMLLQEYDIESAQDIQDALKDLLGGTIKDMMEAEMDEHLGYSKSERSDSDDYRNGYKTKQVNSSYGSMEIKVPQERKSTFEPQIVKKRQKDISDIDQKIISMYLMWMVEDKKWSPETCNLRMTAIRSLLSYAAEECIDITPLSASSKTIQSLSAPAGEIEYFEDYQMEVIGRQARTIPHFEA